MLHFFKCQKKSRNWGLWVRFSNHPNFSSSGAQLIPIVVKAICLLSVFMCSLLNSHKVRMWLREKLSQHDLVTHLSLCQSLPSSTLCACFVTCSISGS